MNVADLCELLAIFDQFAKSHPSTAYLSLGLSDGGYASWPDDAKLTQYDPRTRPWYQAAIAAPGKTVRTGAYYWAPDDVVLIGTVRTVADATGNVLGVVGLDVSLKQLTELVRTIKLGRQRLPDAGGSRRQRAGGPQRCRTQFQAPGGPWARTTPNWPSTAMA